MGITEREVTEGASAVDGAPGFLALLLTIGGDTYAVPLDKVREVVPGPTITNLPTAPPVIRGVFNLRGDIVPLYDTGALLGFPVGMAMPYAILVETGQGLAGIAATSMPETIRLRDPVGRAEIDGGTETYMAGAERIVMGLDLNILLNPARIAS
jgi:purine-binding chemotaxis protein CheW